MYVEKLTMKDFRCFEQAEVTFVYPGKEGLPKEAIPNVTLLIGINGLGKTSVLKGVALGVLAPIIWFIGYRPYFLVRRAPEGERQPKQAKLDRKFKLEEGENPVGTAWTEMVIQETIHIGTSDEGDWFDLPGGGKQKNPYRPEEAEQSPASFFALGYAALRRAEDVADIDSSRAKRRHVRYQRLAGLFEEPITLFPLAAWFKPLKKDRRDVIRELLNETLPPGTRFTGDIRDGEAVFTHNGVRLPFGALSDGFRSYVALLADMLFHMNTVSPDGELSDLTGVVMIDDIDVHLHPKWQREVVPKLAGTFPKLQFIITSHSPLVAGTLHAANIRVIEDNKIHEYTERIHGLSADQILTSSYFMLDTSRSPAAVKTLQTIEKRVADTHDPSAAIDFLNELSGKKNGHPPKKAKKPGKKSSTRPRP
jgi:hypothetical protein